MSVVVAVDIGTWDLLGEVDGKDWPQRRVAARSEKAPGWRRFSGPRTGDWPSRRAWSRPPPREAGRVEKCWTRGERVGAARAKGLPWSAHTLLFPAAGVACGGAAWGGPGVGPHQPADSFGIASCSSWELCEPERLKRKLKTRCHPKNFGLCEAVALRFCPRDGYLPRGTRVFGFPVC